MSFKNLYTSCPKFIYENSIHHYKNAGVSFLEMILLLFLNGESLIFEK